MTDKSGPCDNDKDGIVEGTSGSDLIDGRYAGDPEGDMIDANDAVVHGARGSDDDYVLAGGGDDIVRAGDGNDTVKGEAGNDTLDGGTGQNQLSGGSGDDWFVGGDGADTFNGGAGQDNLDYSGSDAGVSVDLSTSQLSGGDAANDRIDGGIDGAEGSAFNDTLVGFDQQGTDPSDTYTNQFWGMAGDDHIEGREGDDYLDGGDDDDTVLGGGGNDTIYGGTGSDSLDGGDGNDKIFGGTNYNAADVDDVITGGKGDDTIHGEGGNDLLSGGSGSNIVLGGEGGDTIQGASDGDVLDGNEDFDTLDLTGLNFEIVEKTVDRDGDGFDGKVNLLDDKGEVTGSFTFYDIEKIVPCFTPGTRIATARGEKLVEDLREGDRVITRDNGIQEIRWIGRKDLSFQDLGRAPHMRPVLIRQGALGHGLPERDMLVSPNHRVLVSNERTSLLFDEREVLVAAKHLVDGDGVQSVDALGTSYIHMLFDRHEVVLSDGTWTESFQPGDYSLGGIGHAQRSELFELFPELETREGLETFTSARRTLRRYEARLLVE